MTLYKEGWVSVNDIPTRVLCWGSWISELKKAEKQKLVLVIAGNPGIAEFYKDFLAELHEKLKIPIWMVSHAGHEIPSELEKKELANEVAAARIKLYNLREQIDHKAAIIKEFTPDDCKIFVIGHSMGAKIALELLKMADIEVKIEKCFMLFPTIERIADTPNARFIQPFVRYFGTVVVFLSWIFTLLPSAVQHFLLKISFRATHGSSGTCTVDGGLRLVNPSVLRNIFYLVQDEMLHIKDLDTETLRKSKKKLKFYYGVTDGWSPLRFYSHLKKQIPEIDAEVCQRGMKHAFTIKSASLMATLMSDWIKELL